MLYSAGVRSQPHKIMIRCMLSAPRANFFLRRREWPIARNFSGSAGDNEIIKESGVDDSTLPTEAEVSKRKKSQRDTFPEELPVTFSDISRANVAIRNGVKRTSCVKSFFLSELIGANVFLKTEFQQFTGSFKERGARNAILALLRENGEDYMRKNGVIAASAGNHALALAYHGKDLNVPVTVVVRLIFGI